MRAQQCRSSTNESAGYTSNYPGKLGNIKAKHLFSKRKLVPWLRVILRNQTVLETMYQPWSYSVTTGNITMLLFYFTKNNTPTLLKILLKIKFSIQDLMTHSNCWRDCLSTCLIYLWILLSNNLKNWRKLFEKNNCIFPIRKRKKSYHMNSCDVPEFIMK